MEVGPFRVLPIDTTSIGFELEDGSARSTYSVALNSAPLAGKVNAASSSGKLSPWSPVTMPGTDRQVAKIPLAATRFAFGYPLDDANCADADDLADSFVACCVLGFYVYVDQHGMVCGVSSLSRGDGLFFNGPFKLWTLRVPLRQHLYDAWRVMPVTMRDLARRGAQGFCWVGPGENFDELVDKEMAVRLWVHGGFFYFFPAGDEKKDCYFAISEAPQAAVDQSRAERRASAPEDPQPSASSPAPYSLASSVAAARLERQRSRVPPQQLLTASTEQSLSARTEQEPPPQTLAQELAAAPQLQQPPVAEPPLVPPVAEPPLVAEAQHVTEAQAVAEAEPVAEVQSAVEECLFCCAAPRELRLHPCGHATACISCTLRLIPRASTLALKCSHCRAAASAVEMLGEIVLASGEQPSGEQTLGEQAGGEQGAEPLHATEPELERHPTFGAIGLTAGVSIEEFVLNVSMSTDTMLAALANELLAARRQAPARSDVAARRAPAMAPVPRPAVTMENLVFAGASATAEEWARLRGVLQRAVDLSLTNPAAVRTMLDNINGGRFSAEHYICMWEDRVTLGERQEPQPGRSEPVSTQAAATQAEAQASRTAARARRECDRDDRDDPRHSWELLASGHYCLVGCRNCGLQRAM